MADIAHIASRRLAAVTRMGAAAQRLARHAKVDAPRPATPGESGHDAQFQQMLDTERLADFLERLADKVVGPAKGVKPAAASEPPKEPEKPAEKVETLTERRQREFEEERKARLFTEGRVGAEAWPTHAMSNQPDPASLVRAKRDGEGSAEPEANPDGGDRD